MSVVERDTATDQFICLACDGIYDVFSNVDLADYINAQMLIKSELDQIATEVVDTSLHKVLVHYYFLLFTCYSGKKSEHF